MLPRQEGELAVHVMYSRGGWLAYCEGDVHLNVRVWGRPPVGTPLSLLRSVAHELQEIYRGAPVVPRVTVYPPDGDPLPW